MVQQLRYTNGVHHPIIRIQIMERIFCGHIKSAQSHTFNSSSIIKRSHFYVYLIAAFSIVTIATISFKLRSVCIINGDIDLLTDNIMSRKSTLDCVEDISLLQHNLLKNNRLKVKQAPDSNEQKSFDQLKEDADSSVDVQLSKSEMGDVSFAKQGISDHLKESAASGEDVQLPKLEMSYIGSSESKSSDVLQLEKSSADSNEKGSSYQIRDDAASSVDIQFTKDVNGADSLFATKNHSDSSGEGEGGSNQFKQDAASSAGIELSKLEANSATDSREKGSSVSRPKEDAASSEDSMRLLAQGHEEASTKGPQCDGKRVYMYELPPEFNLGILKDCEFRIAHWLNFCTHKENTGFGRPLAEYGDDWREWFASDPYMLEMIFQHRMPHYRCITHDPLEADVFFIPYYTGLDALYYLFGCKMSIRTSHGLKLLAWLDENAASTWRRHGGLDHFIVMGCTAWDLTRPLEFGQHDNWGTSVRVLKDMENVTALFLERRTWVWNEQEIPYPTAFHPSSAHSLVQWQAKVRASPRPFLFAFAGAPRTGNLDRIRQAALEQCVNASSPSTSSLSSISLSTLSSSGCMLLDCIQIKCAHNPKPIAESLLQTQFCLQPPGDTKTRRSTFDGMLSGCIPVFFHKDSAYIQYQWHLPQDADRYSVFVQERDLYKVQEILSSYSMEKIQEMRETIIGVIPNIIYVKPEAASRMATRDAIDIIIDRMIERFANYKRLASQ